TVHFNIDSGPIIEVRTTGASVPRSKLRELIPVYQERSVDRALLIEGQLRLVEYFQAQGYFDAKVQYKQTNPEPGRSVIEYQIDRGDRNKVEHIEFAGNEYFKTEVLRERMYLQTASLLRRRYGRFSEQLLKQDENSIRDLYRANGFRDVEVNNAGITDDYG